MYAKRTDHLKPEGAYQVLSLAQQMEAEGHLVIHFEAGQPDFDTFANISLAGVRAITEGHTRYTPPAGMSRLREAIAEQAGRQRNLSIRPEQVVVSPGAKPNMFFPTLALVEPGDEVIYPDPGFPTYEAMIILAGGVPVPIPLQEKTGFTFDLEVFDQVIGNRTKMVILNSPGNPTGGVIPMSDLQYIAQAIQNFGAWVMSDEIYARIVYDDLEAPSIAQVEGMLERQLLWTASLRPIT
jgi:aspartate aminotransferase